MKSWKTAALLGSLLYFALYGFHLGVPAEKYYDEVYEVTTAQELVARSGYSTNTHPPLIMIIMAAAIKWLGDSPWVWRLTSLLFGWGILISLGFLIWQWTKNAALVAVSLFLLFFDGLFMTQSRIGMLNQGMLFWMLASLVCLGQYAVTYAWPRKKSFLLTGICFGLAMCSRWVALGTFFLWVIPALKILTEKPQEKKGFLKDVLVWILLPALAAYFIPFLIFLFLPGFSWMSIIDLQFHMTSYHLYLKEAHTYASRWWGWPFLVRPIWYEFKDLGSGMIRGILSIGNPAIFWMLMPSLYVTIKKYLKTKNYFYALLAVGFLSQWLIWIPVKRTTFFHYFHVSMPFGAMMLAVWICDALKKEGCARRLGFFYLATVLGMFIYWYPLYAGVPISEVFFRQHMWFSNWI